MDYYVLIIFLILLLPAVFMALYKHYIVIPNEKYDCLPLRFIFTAPYFFMICAALFLALSIISGVFHSKSKTGFITCALAASGFMILWYCIFNLKKDTPPERDLKFFDYDFYLYTPAIIQCVPIIRSINEPPYFEGHKDTSVDVSILRNKTYFTNNGEFIVHKSVPDIFNKNGLSGYFTVPLKDSVTKTESEEYSVIIVDRILPNFHKSSTLHTGISYERILVDGYACYLRSDLNDANDFNRTTESVDKHSTTCYGGQRYWILSKKTVQVLIEELGQPKRDFQPVYLTDDETLDS